MEKYKYKVKEDEKCFCEFEESVIYTRTTLVEIKDEKRGMKLSALHSNRLEPSEIQAEYWDEKYLSRVTFKINYCPVCGRKLK